MRIENGELVDTYEQLISIPGEIPEAIQSLTHIYPQDLEGKPDMDSVRSEIEEHIGKDTIIVGQNVGFDIRMLKGEGIDLTDRPWIDTSMIASLVYPELQSYSLGYMSQVLGLDHAPVHRALGDVRATLELLQRSWERLQELSPELMEPLRTVSKRSPAGYQMFFGALEGSDLETPPPWLVSPEEATRPSKTLSHEPVTFGEENIGTVQLLEAPVNAGFLQGVIDGLPLDGISTYWVGVKNLFTTLRQISVPEQARILHPSSSLLDPHAVQQLANQEQFTADEATLALKLAWYQPQTRSQIPLHGDERSVWNAKVASVPTAQAYVDQFTDMPPLVLIDHQHLLQILGDETHPARTMLGEETHIIVDDASMLEDTATKAYGGYCSLNDMRAAAEGNDVLTGFLDILQIWVERIREIHDTYHITLGNLKSPEASGLRDQLEQIMNEKHFKETDSIYKQFADLQDILDANKLQGRITWIEQRQDGSQFIQAAPERIGTILKEQLYDRLRTTLLIPPESGKQLTEAIPLETETSVVTSTVSSLPSFSIAWEGKRNTNDILSDPPDGKTIILMGSRGKIEDAFVKYTTAIDELGGTLICQGFSGGAGRMQSSFLAGKEPVLWLLTPWAFEGIHLDLDTIDTLVIDRMPFDHPNHTVLGKRGEHYRSAFGEYSLPRMQHRLYRLLRTFSRFCKGLSEVLVLDERMESKEYGQKTWKYLERLTDRPKKEDKDDEPPKPKKKAAKPKSTGQADMTDLSQPNDDFKQSGVGQMQMF